MTSSESEIDSYTSVQSGGLQRLTGVQPRALFSRGRSCSVKGAVQSGDLFSPRRSIDYTIQSRALLSQGSFSPRQSMGLIQSRALFCQGGLWRFEFGAKFFTDSYNLITHGVLLDIDDGHRLAGPR